MTRYFILLAICALAISPLVIANQPAPTSPASLGAGVFYSTSSGWAKMLEAPSPSFRTQGDTAWFFDPINRSQIWYEYLGSASPIQFTEHKPVFHANLGYMPDRDLRLVQIIRLKQKTDRREARLSWSTGDMLARFSGTVPVMLAQAADGVFTITPQSDLEKGEYLLSFGRMMMKYDFGVR